MFLQKILDATDARIWLQAHPTQSAKRPRAVRVPGTIPNQIGGKCPGQGQCGEEKQVHSARARYGARRQQDWCSRYRDADLLGEHPEWQGYVAIAYEISQSLGHVFCFCPLEKECRKHGYCYNKACLFATVRSRTCGVPFCARRAISVRSNRQVQCPQSDNKRILDTVTDVATSCPKAALLRVKTHETRETGLLRQVFEVL